MGDELTLADEKPEINPQVIGEVEEDVEPIGAQILRRLHKDHSILMRDYDDALRHLEHPEVRAHLTEHLKGKDKFLSATEKLFKRHYKELPPLEDQDEDEDNGDENGEELVEQEDDVVENLEPQHKDLTQDEIDEFQQTLNEQAADTEENPVDDAYTTDAVAADSDQEQYPTPEEALEGMEVDRKSVRGYKVKNTAQNLPVPQQQQQKKKPGIIRRNAGRIALGAGAAALAGAGAAVSPKIRESVVPAAKKVASGLVGAVKPTAQRLTAHAGDILPGAAARLAQKVGDTISPPSIGERIGRKVRGAAKVVGQVIDAPRAAVSSAMSSTSKTGEAFKEGTGETGSAIAKVAKAPFRALRRARSPKAELISAEENPKAPVATPYYPDESKKPNESKKSLEDDKVCQECLEQGKTECNCMGNKAMNDEQYEDESTSFYDDNAEDIDETRDYLRELAESQDYGDEQRQKSFHYHKVMRKLGDKLAKTATALGSKAFCADGEKGVVGSTLRTAGKLAALGGAGYLAYKNPAAVAALGRAALTGGRMAVGAARGAAPALGVAAGRLGSAAGKVGAAIGEAAKSPAGGKVARNLRGAAHNVGAALSGGVAGARTAYQNSGKALSEDDERLMQEEDQFESQDEYQGPSDEELQKAYDSVAKVADFFNDLSKTRDFGDKHRAAADLFRKEMDILIDGDNDEEEEKEDREEEQYDEAGYEPGETGRKALELKKALEKRDAAIDDLQRKLNNLSNVICCN